MVGITDIPDWCYVEAFGKGGLNSYSEAPSAQDLNVLYRCSPISHLSKVKVPTLFLLGAQDRRVPVSNGFQYVQALRASGLEVKVILFPEDVHAIDRYAFQRTRCFPKTRWQHHKLEHIELEL
jgi:acylaminoacyl-peptidase